MDTPEIRREAKRQAGLMLVGNLNGWEPDDLVRELGQDNVDRIALEMSMLARRLIRDGSPK
ncbi:MAG TPA: hypothetical protein VFX97_20730 [Pyrinomonadaceae bacterium]|nr:hypothetical protein [Pyrinomonadaceae bacterium]